MQVLFSPLKVDSRESERALYNKMFKLENITLQRAGYAEFPFLL